MHLGLYTPVNIDVRFGIPTVTPKRYSKAKHRIISSSYDCEIKWREYIVL